MNTRSPISKMPVDENILKRTEIHKVKHRYQDVRRNIGGHRIREQQTENENFDFRQK